MNELIALLDFVDSRRSHRIVVLAHSLNHELKGMKPIAIARATDGVREVKSALKIRIDD